MQDKLPEVSVVIPAYRCANTIDIAIQSVLMQAVDFEIIVINDKSPDNLDEVMEKYIDCPQIVYIKNPENIGAAASRNKGIVCSKAPYIAFLDSDDCWKKDKLKKQLQIIKENDAVMCSTARELMTVDGKETGHIIPVKNHITYKDLLRHNSISCSSVLIKREVASEFPMCHEDSHEDYIMWLRVLQKYKFACGINEPLILYRLSSKGKSGNKFTSAKMTWKVYRYMGFGICKASLCFISYAIHGIWKYLKK